jgi:hypothetical protein
VGGSYLPYTVICLLAMLIACLRTRPHAASAEAIPMSTPSFENPLAGGLRYFVDSAPRFDRSVENRPVQVVPAKAGIHLLVG